MFIKSGVMVKWGVSNWIPETGANMLQMYFNCN